MEAGISDRLWSNYDMIALNRRPRGIGGERRRRRPKRARRVVCHPISEGPSSGTALARKWRSPSNLRFARRNTSRAPAEDGPHTHLRGASRAPGASRKSNGWHPLRPRTQGGVYLGARTGPWVLGPSPSSEAASCAVAGDRGSVGSRPATPSPEVIAGPAYRLTGECTRVHHAGSTCGSGGVYRVCTGGGSHSTPSREAKFSDD